MNYKPLMLQDYPSITFDKVRFRDTDRQGHINNAVFATYLETGRVELFYAREVPLTAKDCVFVIVQSNLSLLAEIQWPGTVEIGTAVVRLGTSSITLAQGLYQQQRLVATAETVIVQIDDQTKKPTPLTATARTVLSDLVLEEN